jgi:hypothetical protein
MYSLLVEYLTLAFCRTYSFQQKDHLHGYSEERLVHIVLPSNGSLQCSNSHPLYTNISPTSSKTLVPGGALGLCIFCIFIDNIISSSTIYEDRPGFPPKLIVVEISQLGLSLCFFNISPFFIKSCIRIGRN